MAKMRLFVAILILSFCFGACKTNPSFRHPSSEESMMGMSMGDPSTPPVCTSFSDTVTDAQQAVINSVIAARSHRLQHALWHATRSGLTDDEKTHVIGAFGPSWGEVHDLCPEPTADPSDHGYNPAGEDFLFMHRQMVTMLRAQFIANHLPCISGWTHVPTTTEWALPDSDTSGPKSDAALAQLTTWDSTFQNPKWLKSISLSQLGWALEFTIHNNLHMRYATTNPPAGFPGVAQTGGAPIPYDGNFPADWQYDKPAYNWLADPYGAAVNPTFWKIHGYVDHLIDLWLSANGYQSVAIDCQGAKSCYQWKGTWTGEIPSNVGTKLGGALGQKEDPSIDTILNQKRMRNQQIGVLTGKPKDGGSENPKAPAPQDPLQFTQSQLCTPSSQ
jgi:hypothetical protein